MEGIHGQGALDVRHAHVSVGEVEGEIDGLGLGNLLDGPKCTVDLGPPIFSLFLARRLLFFFSFSTVFYLPAILFVLYKT